MARLQAGRFYVVGFGNGTQLIYVESVSKSGKRAEVRRCQAWRDAARAYWDHSTSKVSVDDKRVREELERVPHHVPDLPTLEFVEARAKARAEINKLWDMRQTEMAERTRAAVAAKSAWIQEACNHGAYCHAADHSVTCPAWERQTSVKSPIWEEISNAHKTDSEKILAAIPRDAGRPVPR